MKSKDNSIVYMANAEVSTVKQASRWRTSEIQPELKINMRAFPIDVTTPPLIYVFSRNSHECLWAGPLAERIKWTSDIFCHFLSEVLKKKPINTSNHLPTSRACLNIWNTFIHFTLRHKGFLSHQTACCTHRIYDLASFYVETSITCFVCLQCIKMHWEGKQNSYTNVFTLPMKCSLIQEKSIQMAACPFSALKIIRFIISPKLILNFWKWRLCIILTDTSL